MKRIPAIALMFTAVAVWAADEWVLPPEPIALKPNPGADLMKANCLMCHSAEYFTTQPLLTREQWKASVTKMQQKYGAPVTDETVGPLVDYLVTSYGRTPAP